MLKFLIIAQLALGCTGDFIDSYGKDIEKVNHGLKIQIFEHDELFEELHWCSTKIDVDLNGNILMCKEFRDSKKECD